MILKVKKIKADAKDIFSLILEKPKGFHFYAGQYLDIELPIQDKLGKTRAFTISSSPTENFLMITTKYGQSRFKKALEKLKADDTITTSHPAGTFILDETSPAVFIAGGIGITPFRSMIKYAVTNKIKTPITLIYSNSDNNFLFKKELDEWQDWYEGLDIAYINTSKQGRLTHLPSTRFAARRAIYHLPIYYLAGSPSFVDDMEKILLKAGVDETNIRYDRFDGY